MVGLGHSKIASKQQHAGKQSSKSAQGFIGFGRVSIQLNQARLLIVLEP